MTPSTFDLLIEDGRTSQEWRTAAAGRLNALQPQGPAVLHAHV